jgi:ABC-2 type transport system permease protein
MAEPTVARAGEGKRELAVRHPLVELTLARCRELFREPEAVFWVFVFPILLSAILGLAFRSRPPEPLPVAIVEGPKASARADVLGKEADLAPQLLAESVARQALTRGRVVLVVSADEPPVYAYDPTQPESRAARLAVDAALQRAAGRTDSFRPGRAEITEPGKRYVDFLVPGLLGMNLMGTGMWGIGFSLVMARHGKLLKRLVAAPARRSHVLTAQLLSRLIFLVPEAAALLVFAYCLLGVPLRGSLLVLAGVSLLGALAFSGLGLLTAARPRTIEGVSGIMNLVMVPMWVFSGIFFSTERFPAALQPFIQALPLTALNDALRGVMLEGAGIGPLLPELLNLGAWSALSFVLALKLFRWE